jgi:hypothetical protein
MGDRIHVALHVGRQNLRPFSALVMTTARHDFRPVAARRLHVGGELPIQIGVIVRRHVAAATPGLVANAEVVNFPRLVAAILATFVGERRDRIGGHVLHPVRHFLRTARAHVAADIDLGADHFGECHELVSAELIRFRHTAPVSVHLHRTLRAIADAVPPVVLVGKTPARPPHHRYVQVPERLDDVVAISVGVRNRRLLAHPHAFVDSRAEMLGELTVDVRIDDRARLIGANGHGHVDRLRRARGRGTGDHDANARQRRADPVSSASFHSCS